MNWSWRKWFRVVHRDFGYLFFGITLVYAISGIAINHLDDWNPNYIITREEINVSISDDAGKDEIKAMLKEIGNPGRYKKHYSPDQGYVKVFIKNGTVEINTVEGYGIIERVKKRPIFREMNYLHYNPVKWWTYFSDLYSVALIILGITGLFLVRGKKGITGQGAWLTILGILIPLIFLFIYYY
jgi:hypothetical protein